MDGQNLHRQGKVSQNNTAWLVSSQLGLLEGTQSLDVGAESEGGQIFGPSAPATQQRQGAYSDLLRQRATTHD